MADSVQPTEIMTVREISEYLKLAPSTIYRLTQSGEIPARKVGGTWRFSRNQIDRWLENPTKIAISELSSNYESGN